MAVSRHGWEEAVGRWATSISSPGNREAYRGAALAFAASSPALSPTGLAVWRDAQLARGLAPSTVKGRVTAVRAFVAWAAQDGVLTPAHAAELLAVGLTATAPTGPALLTAPQLRALDGAAQAVWPDDRLRALQARAVLRTLGGSGLRLQELCAARWSDLLAGPPPEVMVPGRGSGPRGVTLLASTFAALTALHDATGRPGGPLVPSLTKHRPARVSRPPEPIGSATVRKLLERLAAQVDLEAGRSVIPASLVTPEALRRTFALRFLGQGGSVADLQARLGHRHESSTARYVGERPGSDDPWDAPA